VGANPLDERGERRPQPVGIGLAEREERAAAPLDVEGRLAAEQDDVCPCHTRRARRGALRPWQHAAVRLSWIGGGQDERRPVVEVAELAEPFDSTGEGELSAAEPFDEIAAAAGADRLERLELAVHGAVSARDPLGANAVPGDDPLPFEQELRECPAVGAS
jgi:hypothetical protein